MDFFAAVITLLLIMDPLGNIPVFLAVLSNVPENRRYKVLIRELLIALAVMLCFLFAGPHILSGLGLSQEAVGIAGALVLMIIAIRMIFPSRGGILGDETDDGEPLVVPLAIPMIAGPSLLATLILLVKSAPFHMTRWFLATVSAWMVTTGIMLVAPFLYRILGRRGLKAIERLMGMILISVSVQMLLNALQSFIK